MLTFVGLIHAEKVQFNADGPVSLGYLLLTVVCVLFALTRPEPRQPDADEIELERLHAGGDQPAEAPAAPEGDVPAPRKETSTV
nr:hypothetical protein GCM10020092_021420 [Actinoplanes digitatis]